MITKAEDINSIESEAGVIATLIHHPEWSFYSEHLLPNHFTDKKNKCVYTSICDLAKKGIGTIDTYNIFEDLSSNEATRRFSEDITIDEVNELIEMSEVLCRDTLEEYKMLVTNVMDAAFRRDMYSSLKDIEHLCADNPSEDVRQMIYNVVDGVMTEYSSANEVPQFKDVVDGYWNEIRARQCDGYAGIPFKFPTLNEYATIEPGELFIFAAEPKQGKSIMLLNCAVDLLKNDYSVLYLDSELNSRLFTARLLSHLTGIEYKRLTSGSYTDKEADRIDKMKEWIKAKKFTHIYMPMFDMQSIYTTVKRVKHTQGLDVLIVDYFKSSGSGDAFDSYQELGRAVDMVKNKIAGDMGIAAIGAAQATAAGKIADSAKIGRNASTIALIQSKTLEEIQADGAECGNKKLRVVLNRNGMQMTSDEYIDLFFDGNLIKYTEAKQHVPVSPY